METGSLCGYVGVSDKSKLFGVNYNDLDFDVHGGLTYSGFWKSEEKDSFYYLGFNAAHAGDIMPFMRTVYNLRMLEGGEKYRDMNYMTNECKKLARQVKNYDKCIEQTQAIN